MITWIRKKWNQQLISRSLNRVLPLVWKIKYFFTLHLRTGAMHLKRREGSGNEVVRYKVTLLFLPLRYILTREFEGSEVILFTRKTFTLFHYTPNTTYSWKKINNNIFCGRNVLIPSIILANSWPGWKHCKPWLNDPVLFHTKCWLDR